MPSGLFDFELLPYEKKENIRYLKEKGSKTGGYEYDKTPVDIKIRIDLNGVDVMLHIREKILKACERVGNKRKRFTEKVHKKLKLVKPPQIPVNYNMDINGHLVSMPDVPDSFFDNWVTVAEI